MQDLVHQLSSLRLVQRYMRKGQVSKPCEQVCRTGAPPVELSFGRAYEGEGWQHAAPVAFRCALLRVSLGILLVSSLLGSTKKLPDILLQVCIYRAMYAYIYTIYHIYIYIHTIYHIPHIYIYIFIHVYLYIHKYICIYIYIYIYKQLLHTFIYLYTYRCVCI